MKIHAKVKYNDFTKFSKIYGGKQFHKIEVSADLHFRRKKKDFPFQ